MTIDMKNYAGEDTAPAAEEQIVQSSDQHEAPVAPPAPAPEQATAPEPPAPAPVPQEEPQERNFKALASEVERIKAERETDRREYLLQLEMMRANTAPKPEPAAKMFSGMEDSDIPNVKEIRQEWDRREAGYQQRIEELQVAQRYPDYAEVIEKFALPLVKEKPHLAEGIQGATNKALFAYELGKMAQQMKQQTQAQPATPPSAVAQKIVENSRKPVSLAAAGGQGALSKADYYATMSDQEFMKLAEKNLGEI